MPASVRSDQAALFDLSKAADAEAFVCGAQFLIIMFLLGINTATDTGHGQPNNDGLIIANTCGLMLNLLWAALAYWTVLHEHARAASALMALLLPCMGMPLVDITLCKMCCHAAEIICSTWSALLLSCQHVKACKMSPAALVNAADSRQAGPAKARDC